MAPRSANGGTPWFGSVEDIVNVGDRVRIERDETRYPSRGTWPQFRGRTGTIIEINVDRKRWRLTEYGVVFRVTRSRPNGSLAGGGTTWFNGGAAE